ncbi:MAG: GNAT family N-acetyltransferase [Erysipelotrichaceae bacterium]|nr:GNAT family N-acetyltransferase [Erysipelotrichaceae bacterium]
MIRYAKAEDIDIIYELICELEDTALDKEAFKQAFYFQLDDDRYLCLLNEDDGTIKGLLNMRIEQQLHHAGKIAEIMELVVGKKYRGNNIGSELIEKAIEIARAEECLRIELSSSKWRTDSHRFYQDKGFIASHINLTKDL